MLGTQVPRWRRAGSGLLGLVGAFGLYRSAGHDATVVAIPLVALALAAVLVWVPALGPQILVRAIWWSNLGLGTALCVLGHNREGRAGFLVTLACGGALLVIGRKGLAEASERADWVPAAFRGSLLLLMVLALADAQTFALFTAIDRASSVVPMVATALAFVVGCIGLYRLAIWGAIVNVTSAIVMLLVALSGRLGMGHDLDSLIAVLMALQIVVALPVLFAIVTKRRMPSVAPRVRAIASVASVTLVMILGITVGLLRGLWD